MTIIEQARDATTVPADSVTTVNAVTTRTPGRFIVDANGKPFVSDTRSSIGGPGEAPSPLDRLPKIVEWSKRMKALGSGKPTPMTGIEALDVAKAATPGTTKVDDKDPSGLGAGQKISVTPDDTGKVPVTGELVGLNSDRVSIKRTDERVGDVVVHFPRAGFILAAA